MGEKLLPIYNEKTRGETDFIKKITQIIWI